MSRPRPFPTTLIGFGRMAQGYAADPVMARHFRYAAHAQVLRDHPAFEWRAVIDPAPDARTAARADWNVETCAATAAGLGAAAADIEVAVLATPPDARSGLLNAFPQLKAVIAEKPLGRSVAEAQAFLDDCKGRGIAVQVNLWRRGDRLFRELAAGRLRELIGTAQAATCLYGNGLVNNGTHMIDFSRMLFGEAAGFQLIGARPGFVEGPIADDTNPRFVLEMANGLAIDFQPLQFCAYREAGLVIWGTNGRLDILAEGLVVRHFPLASHRSMKGEREIAVDAPRELESTVGDALYEIYDDLARYLATADGGKPGGLCSPGDSALVSTALVDQIRCADLARRGDAVAGS